MAERPPSETPFERVDPEQVSDQSFAITRKGFDQRQVKAYLVSMSNQIRAGQQQIRDLREQVTQADEQPAKAAEFSPQGVNLLDGGVEASRRIAQIQADGMETKARQLASKLQSTVEGLRSQPGFSETEDVADLLEQACEQALAVAGLLQDARAQAEAEVDHGRDQGRKIVEQAKTLRLTVLRDMARRRQTARSQVERLRAGRDQLMTTLADARKSIDDSIDAARHSLAEAKVAADAAARRLDDEAEPADTALLSELDDAQTMGMIPDIDAVGEHDDQPVAPDQPDESGLPEGSVAPDQPDEPVASDQPDEPVASDQPDEPVAPDQPDEPVASDQPGGSVAPVDHPVLASTGDTPSVDALFARLRSQSDAGETEAQTESDAAKPQHSNG